MSEVPAKWKLRGRALGWLLLPALLLSLSMGAWGGPEMLGWLVFPAMFCLLHYVKMDAVGTESRWVGFRRGYAFGFCYFLATLTWIWNVFPAANLPLALYLAFYPALWAGLCRPLLRTQHGWRPMLLAVSSWTALEWLRGWILTGFGWSGLPIALVFSGLPFLQLAEWIGTTGLAVLLWLTVMPWVFLSGNRRFVGLGIFLLANAAGYGLWLRAQSEPTRPVPCLLLQSNVLQAHRWKVQERELGWANMSEEEQNAVSADVLKFYEDLETQTKQGIASGGAAELVVWPESALYYPLNYPYHPEFFDKLGELGKFTILSGVDIIQDGAFTGAVAISGKFENQQIYRKTHLVPFGEYLPLRKELPFMQSLLGGLLPQDFDTGTVREPLAVADFQIIPSICFEDSVGRVARDFVRPAPQILANMTNDGWFKESHAVSQHFRNSLMRSIELRRPLVRAANTGITAAVDSMGKVLAQLPPHKTDQLSVTVPMPTAGRITLYAAYGEWFSAFCGGLSVLLFLVSKKRQTAEAESPQPPQ